MGTGDDAREAVEKRLIRSAETYIARLGEGVMYIQRMINEADLEERYLTEIRFRVRYGDQGDVLVVVKADQAKDKLIAFHSADTFDEALSGLASRLRNGSLKWKEDTPYGEGRRE